jgi:hypothetical protein
MRAIFLARVHPLSCFSRARALCTSSYDFPIDEANDVVAVGKSFEMMKFVLEDATVEIAAHSDVERAGEAGHNVSAIVARVAHGLESSGVLGWFAVMVVTFSEAVP